MNGWCYWTLRKEGFDSDQSTRQLRGKPTAELNELLLMRGVNYNDLPEWQRRGTGVYWERYEKVGFNPVAGSAETAERRRIKRDESLPVGQDYEKFILACIDPIA
jgi:tRNA(His) 5'-end guanylyltransferase